MQVSHCDGCEDIRDPAHVQRGFSSGRTGVSSGLTEKHNYGQPRYIYSKSEAVHGFDESIWKVRRHGIGHRHSKQKISMKE